MLETGSSAAQVYIRTGTMQGIDQITLKVSFKSRSEPKYSNLSVSNQHNYSPKNNLITKISKNNERCIMYDIYKIDQVTTSFSVPVLGSSTDIGELQISWVLGDPAIGKTSLV